MNNSPKDDKKPLSPEAHDCLFGAFEKSHQLIDRSLKGEYIFPEEIDAIVTELSTIIDRYSELERFRYYILLQIKHVKDIKGRQNLDTLIEKRNYKDTNVTFLSSWEKEKKCMEKENAQGDKSKSRDESEMLRKIITSACAETLKEVEEQYVGLTEVKDYILNFSESLSRMVPAINKPEELVRLFGLRGIIFSGNPGSGKTISASIIAKFLFKLGVLSTPTPISITSNELYRDYLEYGEKRIWDLIKEAQEHKALLFIDDAHLILYSEMYIITRALSLSLQDFDHPFFLALSFFPQEKQFLSDSIPGMFLHSAVINLPDYNGDELYNILEKKAKKNHFSISRDAAYALKDYCNGLYESRSNNYQNAWEIEDMVRKLNFCHRKRISMAWPEADFSNYGLVTEKDAQRYILSQPDLWQEPLPTLDELLRKINERKKELDDRKTP